jgi:hypothetical protein
MPTISFIISAGFIVLALTVPDLLGYWHFSLGLSPTDRDIVRSLLAGLAASFLFVAVVDTITRLRRIIALRHFAHIFGTDALAGDLFLVYPEFVLSEEAKTALSQLHPTSIYDKIHRHFSTYHIDIPKTVSENDIKAAIIMSSVLADTVPESVRVTSDTDAIREPDRSFISFGLRSNDFTWMYFEQETDPLFTIHMPTEGDRKNDSIVIRRDGEPIAFQSTDSTQYGIILKVTSKAHPKRTWILCSGLGAVATPSAAWYLANNWRELERRAKDEDFLLVLKVPSYSFRAATEVDFIVRAKSRFMRTLLNRLASHVRQLFTEKQTKEQTRLDLTIPARKGTEI